MPCSSLPSLDVLHIVSVMHHHSNSQQVFDCIHGKSTVVTPRVVKSSGTLNIFCRNNGIDGDEQRKHRTRHCPVVECRTTHSVHNKRHIATPPSYHDASEISIPRLVHRQPRREMPPPPHHCVERDRLLSTRANEYREFHRGPFLAAPKPQLPEKSSLMKHIASMPCTK